MASKRVIVSVLKRLVEKKVEELKATVDERVMVLIRAKAQEILDAEGKGVTVDAWLADMAARFDAEFAYVKAMPRAVRKALGLAPNDHNPFKTSFGVTYLVPPSDRYASVTYEFGQRIKAEDNRTIEDLKAKIEAAELKLAFGADLDKVKEILKDLGFDPKEVGL